jgi:16S rRNA (cytosine967-C5)-methyltransferase
VVAQSSRQSAFLALRAIERGAFADVALDKVLQATGLTPLDRRLVTELVYGSVRRQRTLDALINQLATKPASQQPADLRLLLRLGLYQLRYLQQIPAAAAVDTTVELAKLNQLGGLAAVVNGILRQYIRLSEQDADPLQLPDDPIQRLGLRHSYPDWIVRIWLEQLGAGETGYQETERLCQWLNQPPAIDLRVNLLRATVEQVQQAMEAAGVRVQPLPPLPTALRLTTHGGAVTQLPGFDEGWWMVQDASAQLVAYLVNPQAGEVIADACAAPGGKTLHLAELMHDRGTVWACDRTASRLKKLKQNRDRLGLQSIQISQGDSRQLSHLAHQCDRVLLDVPCSGLGTLNRHADARWRQTPDSVQELTQLQAELLEQCSTWVKPGGCLVYATCTLHPAENEQQIQRFLAQHPNWQLEPPDLGSPATAFVTPEGWVKIWPHRHQMDGFFVVRLRQV